MSTSSSAAAATVWSAVAEAVGFSSTASTMSCRVYLECTTGIGDLLIDAISGVTLAL